MALNLMGVWLLSWTRFGLPFSIASTMSFNTQKSLQEAVPHFEINPAMFMYV
jgi:hypothetical protein